MGKFGVTAQKEAELERRLQACGVRESDLDEGFIRSGGPGGQHVNRTATCVQLRHKPTGIEVKMQKARSQGLNRFYARRRLCELIEALEMGEESPEAKRQAKLRKQKACRRRKSRKKLGSESSQETGDSSR